MARFELQPVELADFQSSSAVFPFTADLNIDATAFWSELTGPSPLWWCRLLRQVDWTSPSPHSVGSTRKAVLAPAAVRLTERYIYWDETDRRYTNAFWVTDTNVPGLRRFAELYEVIPTESGCRFTWTFLVEPSAPVLLRLARPVVEAVLKRFILDTQREFG